MRCPSLSDLPAPPPGRVGWPWTEESPRIDDVLAESSDLPSISIVTPSLNQGSFIEATIRSVLLQGYPKLEYVVMDGGSRDQSVDVIRRYERWLTTWSSAPDRGQSHAINKALAHCGGTVFNWINSDDYLAPGALVEVGRVWASKAPNLLVGRGLVVDGATGRVVHDWSARPPRTPLDFIAVDRVVMSQPSTFMELRRVREVGGLREDLHYVLDWELYLRFVTRLRISLRTAVTSHVLSYSVGHQDAKTTRAPAAFRKEALYTLRALYPSLRVSERIRVSIYVQRMQIQDLIEARGYSLSRLLPVVIHHPLALLSRPYWGAVRRSVTGRSHP